MEAGTDDQTVYVGPSRPGGRRSCEVGQVAASGGGSLRGRVRSWRRDDRPVIRQTRLGIIGVTKAATGREIYKQRCSAALAEWRSVMG